MRAMLQVFSFELLSKGVLAIAGIALIRFMPQTDYALLTYALACAAFASQALAFAFNRVYVVSPIAATRDRIEGMISAQVMLVAVLGVALLPASSTLGALYLLVVPLVLMSALGDFTKTMYQREKRFLSFSLVELGRSLLYVGVVIALWMSRGALHVRWVLSAQVAAMALAVLVAWRVERRPVPRISMIRGIAVLREMVRGPSRFLLFYFLLLSLFGQLETLILGRLSSDAALASYGAASRYYGLLSLALGAVHTVLLPLVHEARQSGTLERVLREQRRMLFVVVPVLLVIAIAAGRVLPLIDAGRYPDAVSAFRILTVSALLSFMLSPYSNVLISAARYPTLCGLVAASMVVGAAVSLTTIPVYGALGAAVAQTCGFFVLNLLTYYFARAEQRDIVPLAS